MLLSGRWIFRTGIILICWAFYRFFLPFCAAHIPIDPILQRPHFASSASKCRTKRCSQLPQPWRARMGHARINSPLVIQLVKLDALGTTQTCVEFYVQQLSPISKEIYTTKKKNLHVLSCLSHQVPKWQSCVLRGDPQHPKMTFWGMYLHSPIVLGVQAVCQADLPRDKVLGIGRRNWTHQSCSDLKSPTKGVVPLHCAASLFFRRRWSWWKPRKIWTWRHHLQGGRLTWDGRTAQNLRCLACLKNQRPSHWWNIQA